MKKDFKRNAMKLCKTLTLCSKKEQELSLLRKKMVFDIIPFLDFYDFNEEHIDLDEYLKTLTLDIQASDGFVFIDEMSRNILAIWVIAFIEKNGKINYSQFLKYSI